MTTLIKVTVKPILYYASNTIIKDVFVWLTETPAPSDFCLWCAIQMLLLTYLLTPCKYSVSCT